MPRALPLVLHLPSGRRVRVEAARTPRACAETLSGALDALDGGLVDLREGASGVEVDELTPGDVHVLRVVLAQTGLVPEPETTSPCQNCGEELRHRPALAVELGPFLDGELDDPELDAAFDFSIAHEIPELRVGRATARTATFAPVTVREARPLFAALASPGWRITSAFVKGMGLVALGDETRAPVLARALAGASDDAWSAIVSLYDAASYPPRLTADVACPSCTARNLVEAPALREFPADPRAPSDEVAGFPDLAAFERIVEEEAEAAYRRLGVTHVDLIVEAGTPDCDAGGVPLLGSYDPPLDEAPGLPARPPEVRVFYRTFRAMFADEPYDVRAEIEETIDHELRHHLAFLSGHDPEDEEERAEIAREQRRLVGETETLRRATRAARGELADFVYRTWPLWAIVLLVAVWTWMSR